MIQPETRMFTIEFRDKDGVLLWTQEQEVTMLPPENFTYQFFNVSLVPPRESGSDQSFGFFIPITVSLV